MMSFEEVGQVLDEEMEELPQGIFEGLNGGVNLINRTVRDEDGNLIMGLYHNDGMGRYIEIFYGSFRKIYWNAGDGELRQELRKVLRHELTHHIENKAGDRSLERWDEEQKRRFREERG